MRIASVYPSIIKGLPDFLIDDVEKIICKKKCSEDAVKEIKLFLGKHNTKISCVSALLKECQKRYKKGNKKILCRN